MTPWRSSPCCPAAASPACPEDEATLRDRLEVSGHSFSGAVAPLEAWYTLMLEDADTGRVEGVAGVKAAVGLRRPFFSFRVVTLTQFSSAIRTRFDHTALVLVNECSGWSEVGSLFLRPERRSGGAGRLLAQARYVLMAAEPQHFAEQVLAELRGWFDEDGSCPFWETVGCKFFRLPFDQADMASASTDGQFILDLAPRHPIYVELLPEAARTSVGRVHREGEPARVMLEREGFRYASLVDIFDAGPTVSARRDEIATVRNSHRRRARIVDAVDGPAHARLVRQPQGFPRRPHRRDHGPRGGGGGPRSRRHLARRRRRPDPDRPMSADLYIGGRWRSGQGPELVSTDPATGSPLWRGATADGADVFDAVASALAAFRPWADAPLDERIAAVRRYKAVLEARTPEFAADISRETGKPLWETRAELGSMIAKVEVSITAQAERAGGREAATGFGRAVLRHRPHGVMAVLGPFNFPGHLPNGHIVPALLAGDTVVFKPSEETPLAGRRMAEAFDAAGLPPGVFNLVQGGRETGAALLAQPIDGLLFTGSARAGAQFRRAFADRVEVILALELGGNNPLIVWDDSDAEAAAAIAVQSAYVTTGQRCSCARRLILPRGAAGDRVVEAIAALAPRLAIGPWDGASEPFMGPLISARAAAGARAEVRRLVAAGARTILPFGWPEGLGDAFVTPALLDVTGVAAPDEEIFAPVLQVIRVDDFEHAIAVANTTRYGLAAGLVSDDEARWRLFLDRVRAGVVNRNRPTTGAAGNMPFGGLGASGDHRPSAYYAADYCAYPVASFEADKALDTTAEIKGLRA